MSEEFYKGLGAEDPEDLRDFDPDRTKATPAQLERQRREKEQAKHKADLADIARRKMLSELIEKKAQLTDRQIKAIVLRYGLDGGGRRTLREISTTLGAEKGTHRGAKAIKQAQRILGWS